jgi:hypothetical protein
MGRGWDDGVEFASGKVQPESKIRIKIRARAWFIRGPPVIRYKKYYTHAGPIIKTRIGLFFAPVGGKK